MAVRQFDGIDDDIQCSPGALSTNAFGTFAAIIRRGAVAEWQTVLGLHNTGGTGLLLCGVEAGNATTLYTSASSNGPAISDATGWRLVVVRKASGTATPRFSVYNYATSAWTHAAGSAALANWGTAGTGGSVRFQFGGFDFFDGRIAVRGAWNTVRWTADAAGDTAIQNAGLHTSLQAWIDASPSALWRFDQASTGTAVTDLTGGGANQTSIVGTTVVTGADPPGFSFGAALTATVTDTVGVVDNATPAPNTVLDLRAAGNTFGLQYARPGDAATIIRSLADLAGGFSEAPYFHTTADGARVHFETRADAPTTAGSAFARSELREVNSDGTNAAWDPTAGEHSMSGTTVITALPAADPEGVIAQVFGAAADADIMSIRTQLVSGTIRLRARVDGTSVTSPQIAAPYTVGTSFNWRMRLTPTAREFYWSFGADPLPATPQVSAAATTETSAYFKAGFYAQFNTATVAATEVGSAELSALTVTHPGGAVAHDRTLTDPVGAVDTVSAVLALSATLVDPVGVADASSRDVTAARAVTDPVGVADAASTAAGIAVALTDSLGVLDTTTAALSAVRDLTSAVGLSDPAGQVSATDRAATDQVGVADSYAAVNDHGRTLADTVGAGDEAGQAVTGSRDLTDPVAAVDAASAGVAVAATVTDSVGLSDTAAAVQGFAVTVVDPVGASDTTTGTTGSSRALTDPVGVVDAASTGGQLSASVTDAIGVADSAAQTVTAARDLAEGVGLVDTATTATTTGRAVTDPLGVVDTAGAGAAVTVTITDTVGVVDTSDRTTTSARDLADPVGVADLLGQVVASDRLISDALALTDAVTAGGSAAHTRELADPVGASDAATPGLDIDRVIADPVGVADSLTLSEGRAVTVSDPIGVTDLAAQAATYLRSITDPTGVVDAVTESGQIAGWPPDVSGPFPDPLLTTTGPYRAGLVAAAGPFSDPTVTVSGPRHDPLVTVSGAVAEPLVSARVP